MANQKITCPSCGQSFSADKHFGGTSCPLCGAAINVIMQSQKEAAKDKGLISVIKYEGGNDVFVWKHPIEDFNLGTQLIVHESQEAVFFKDGRALDLFGAGRHTLETQNLPMLEKIYKLPAGGKEMFHSEVYFINMTTQMGIKWGTDSKVRLFDPASGLHIEIGASGNFNLRVSDSRRLLINIVGTAGGLTQDEIIGGYGTAQAVGKFRALVMNKVKSNLSRAIKEQGINILEIDEHIDELSESLRIVINQTLDEYGLTMPEFYITSIMTPDDDPNYKRLRQQFADRTLLVREEEIRKAEAEAARGRKIVEAQTEAQLKAVSAQGEAEAVKIKAFAEAEAYKAQAYAEAEEMRAKGFTYQQQTAREVGLEAMQNGITGGSGGGSIGDLAALGVSLGAMGGVMQMTKDSLDPVMQSASNIGKGIGDTAAPMQGDVWNCNCGAENIVSNFCPDCGAKRPDRQSGWDCVCGAKNITSKFCPDCGAKKPNDGWDCTCGAKNIKSRFCPDCGKEKGVTDNEEQ